VGRALVEALAEGGLGSRNDETRLRASAGAELVAGIAKDLRALRVGIVG
jgi:hypothetical protein